VSHPTLARHVDAFAGLDVLVLGEAMLDTYLDGATSRVCREAPVPIVALHGRRDAPGGGANAAANAAALGARVHFLSAVGDDAEGEALRAALARQGVDPAHVLVQPGRRTLSKTRVVAASQLLVRYDQGCTGPVSAATEWALLRRLADLYPRCDAVIVSDYGYGVLTPAVVAALGRHQRRTPRVLVADSKALASYRDVGLTAVKPNYDEARALLAGGAGGPFPTRPDEMIACGPAILERTGARMAAITLDTDGAVVLERDRPAYRTYATPRPHSRAAGAGDTFLAGFAMALAAGADTPAAADLASAACAVVVAHEGTTACSAAELRDALATDDKPATDPAGLARRLSRHRREGRRIVFTNGCFDILHRGHITYLSQAKALGDILVVGLNSDEGIRRLKGPTRPINALEDRVELLAALSCVDHIIPFGEDTPCELVRTLRPDVFVKGGDYTRERLPEAEIVESYGGEVRILPFVDDRSTTNIIERIRAAYAIPTDGLSAASPFPAAPGAAHAGLNGGGGGA
jgi:D-beta-D-heptose 7-phosphate kinase/D-beta-D-heptose 1-phosphate adenosyltransferase